MGLNHTCFLTDNSQLYAMGDNKFGQLGLGSPEMSNATYPTLVTTLSTFHVKDVACGFDHTLVQTS